MESFELVVRFNNLQHFLSIAACDTLIEVKKRIESMCAVDLINGEYVLEIYDTTLEDYIVLTERYLVELNKRLSTTAKHRLKARLEPPERKEDPSPTFIGHRSYTIVWVDQNIGRPQDYSSLKRVFNSMVDTDGASCLTTEEWRDFENLMLLERNPVHTAIHFFDQSDDCLTFVRENAASIDIFLVTSSKLGRDIVPLVADQVRAIYVLCFFTEGDTEWAFDYVEHIKLFDFDTDLVIHLTRDIIDYCVKQGKERINNNGQEAVKYLSMARKLLLRVNIIDKRRSDKELRYVDHLLHRLTDNQAKCLQCEET